MDESTITPTTFIVNNIVGICLENLMILYKLKPWDNKIYIYPNLILCKREEKKRKKKGSQPRAIANWIKEFNRSSSATFHQLPRPCINWKAKINRKY